MQEGGEGGQAESRRVKAERERDAAWRWHGMRKGRRGGESGVFSGEAPVPKGFAAPYVFTYSIMSPLLPICFRETAGWHACSPLCFCHPACPINKI